jgi:uncharacterized protein (TIGR03437 family)
MRRQTYTAYLISGFLITLCSHSVTGQSLAGRSEGWVVAGELHAARAQACMATLKDGRLLVIGGSGPSGAVATVEIYATGGSVAEGPKLLQARTRAACATLRDGRVLVTGGNDGAAPISSSEMFDPTTNLWQPADNLSTPREGLQAVTTVGGEVWIIGGTASGVTVGEIEIYGADARFHSRGRWNSPRTHFAVTTTLDGDLVVAGGADGSGTLNSVEIRDGRTGAWSVAGTMHTARKDFTASQLTDGTILFAGGEDSAGNPLASTEIFDPQQGTTTAGPSLLTPRANHTAYTLPGNGAVLLFGGNGARGVGLTGTEIYRPWTGAIAPAGEMKTARWDAVAGAAGASSVLVAGGRNGGGLVRSSELYRFAAVTVDKPVYAPGTPVTITGAGWAPGETVSLSIETALRQRQQPVFTAVAIAGSDGALAAAPFETDRSLAPARYLVTAEGNHAKAQTVFTTRSQQAATITIQPVSVDIATGNITRLGRQVTVLVTVGNSTNTVPTGAIGVTVAGGNIVDSTCGSPTPIVGIAGTEAVALLSANTYLILYGTGFDDAQSVTVTVNGQVLTPAYFGPQGNFAGLDQINLLLPTSLAGSGEVNVSITVDGSSSNVGKIAFQ